MMLKPGIESFPRPNLLTAGKDSKIQEYLYPLQRGLTVPQTALLWPGPAGCCGC